jgi:hypothetical protein
MSRRREADLTIVRAGLAGLAEDTDQTLREAFDGVAGGPWTIHLAPSVAQHAWLSVKIVSPGRVLATSVAPEDQVGEKLRRRVRALLVKGPPSRA